MKMPEKVFYEKSKKIFEDSKDSAEFYKNSKALFEDKNKEDENNCCPEYAGCCTGLGIMLYKQGETEEAAKLFERADAILEKFGKDSKSDLATDKANNLKHWARCLKAQNLPKDA